MSTKRMAYRDPRGFKRLAVRLRFAGVACLLFGLIGNQTGLSAGPPTTADTSFLRINPSQYTQIISDIFGPVVFNASFEPDVRDDGLLAVGSRRVSISSAGFEQYDAAARTIAAQVFDKDHRALFVPCSPKVPSGADDECARIFIEKVGRLLYRRPLNDDEINSEVAAAAYGATTLHDFYAGLRVSLTNMLDSANFLFRQRRFVPHPSRPQSIRLDAYSRASQLSFFLWNTTPDDQLLRAAETGRLNTEKGMREQVDRLIHSTRLEDGVRAFFSDMLGFDGFLTLEKDPAMYPHFTKTVMADAPEQTLRTIVDLLIKHDGDYRDIFTTRQTFLTPSLAALYDLPLLDTTENGAPDRWFAYTYKEGDPRAGILSEASFVALHSHAARTSPTIRGKAVRENILCQHVPPPPGNVDFTLFEDSSNPDYKTARDRLTAHRKNPVCAGCHRITDPIGLALENFDTAGGYRRTENGAPIDSSGQINGKAFSDVLGLSQAIRDDPATVSCLATRLFAFGAGHSPPSDDPRWQQITQGFAHDGYRLPNLMQQIALSDLFYSGTRDQPAQNKSASLLPRAIQEPPK
jgi:hypothetical protein